MPREQEVFLKLVYLSPLVSRWAAPYMGLWAGEAAQCRRIAGRGGGVTHAQQPFQSKTTGGASVGVASRTR